MFIYRIQILVVLLLSCFFAVSASAAPTRLQMAAKYDGHQVKLRWQTVESGLDYRYRIYRNDIAQRQDPVLVAEVGLASYEEAKKRLSGKSKAALPLIYPRQTITDRAELIEALGQEQNRLGIISYMAALDQKVANVLGLAWQDLSAPKEKVLIYTVEMYRGETRLETTQVAVQTTAAIALPLVTDLRADRFQQGIGITWQSYEPFIGFNIYRSDRYAGEYKKINRAPVQVQSKVNADGTVDVAPYFFTDTEIVADRDYFYQVQGIDLFGDEGPTSIPVQGRVRTDPRPLAPQGVELNEGEHQIGLSWNEAINADVLGYHVYRSDNTDRHYRKITSELVTETAFVDRNIDQETNYFYTVTAMNKGGYESLHSLAKLGVVRDRTPPAVPVAVQSTVSPGKVVLSWKAASDTDLAGYQVYRSMNPNDRDWALLNQNPLLIAEFTDTLSKSLSRYPYYYRITSIDLNHNVSEPSQALKVQLPDVTPPPAPQVTDLLTRNEQVAISWLPQTVYDLAGYRAYRVEKGKQTLLTSKLSPFAFFTDSKPPVGVDLEYRITALDISGNESDATAVTVKVADATAPRVELSSLDWDGKAVAVKFSSSASDLLYFRVLRSQNKRDFVVQQKLKENRFDDTNVLAGKHYYYQIEAWDLAGNHSTSVIKKVTVPR